MSSRRARDFYIIFGTLEAELSGERVRDPRHILICKIVGDVIVVVAVGHDAMEEGIERRIEEGEGS